MSVSTKGFCENVLTLKAASGLKAGVPVAVSANDTVSAAGADAKFCGVSVNVNGGYAGVQLSGVVTMPYTGTDAPAVGYAALAADGAGGVKVSTKGNNLPTPVLFAAMTIGSMAAGALWGFVPAWFKSRWGTNETLFTLMMNYVATSIVACMTNIMRGQASSLGTLNKATKAGWLPVINGQRYTINIIVVLVLTFAMYAYLKYSKQGYEISVVGESENTARYAGINVSRVMIRTMLLSGAICGLCGFLVVAGKDQTISTTSAGGNGFTAIIVAWLAKFNTFYMMLISFLLIFLDRGASEIASAYSLNEYAADIITGIILFFILGSEFFINYRLVWRGHHDGKEGK